MSGSYAPSVETSSFSERSYRRWWLLCKGLECFPLDRALELARAADEFVTGLPAENPGWEATVRPAPVHVPPRDGEQQHEAGAADLPRCPELTESKPRGLALSAEQREQLLGRLARGARNAELAAELGLSSKQIQGIRMGSAREIARRRDHLSHKEQPDAETTVPALADDIVRYLRQQDDVVVPQDGGEYLVNARFRLPLAQLVSRANRMRSRQGKPQFALTGTQSREASRVTAANGHPLFWDGIAAS